LKARKASAKKRLRILVAMASAAHGRAIRAMLASDGYRLSYAGDVEAVIVANNSGHFKPAFDDLDNTIPSLEKFGIPREKIVLFGGPNNLPSMLEEIGEKYPELDIVSAMPPTPEQLHQQMAAQFDPLSVRLPRS